MCTYSHLLVLVAMPPPKRHHWAVLKPIVIASESHIRIISEYLVALETEWNDYGDNNDTTYHDGGDCKLMLSLTHSDSEEWAPAINTLEKKEMWIQGSEGCVREQIVLALLTKPLDTVPWNENFPKSEHPIRKEALIKELVGNNDEAYTVIIRHLRW